MNKTLPFFILALIVLWSCKKENEDFLFIKDNGFTHITIDTLKYTYISPDGDYFHKGQFKSKNDVQSFNLKLEANRKYRISSAQPYIENSNIDLSLFSGSDTVTISYSKEGSDAIYFNTSKAGDYMLKAKLKNAYNLSLDYYLYFEELKYAPLVYNEHPLEYRGHFESMIDTLTLYPSHSYWNNWIKLNAPIPYLSNISYRLKLSHYADNNTFGFMIGASDLPKTDSYIQNDLPYGLHFSINNHKFSISEYSSTASQLINSGDLPRNLNLSDSVQVDIMTTATYSNYKQVFINHFPITYIEETGYDNFHIVFDDNFNDPIQIYDLQISQ